MRIVNKHNFFYLVCVCFTLVTLHKIIYETIYMNNFGAFQGQLLQILVVSIIIMVILSQHHRIFNLPLFLAIIIQYLLVIILTTLLVWITGLFTELAIYAYRDMFVSVTFFYLVTSIIYYIFFFIELKKHNTIIQKLKKHKKDKKEN